MTTPLSGMVYHPLASTCYDQPINQIWSLYLHPPRRYDRWYRISKMGWFGVVTDHSGSVEIVSFDRAHTSSYYGSIVTILHRFLDTARYWSKIDNCNLPTPLEFRGDLWQQQKTRVHGLSYGVVCMILGFAILVQYGRVTDGQDGSIYRASIAKIFPLHTNKPFDLYRCLWPKTLNLAKT